MSECDFCNAESEPTNQLNPINDGLWNICDICMHIHYEIIPNAVKLIQGKKPEELPSPRLTLEQAWENYWQEAAARSEEE